MRFHRSLLVCLSLLVLFSGCQLDKTTEQWIPLRTEYLRNGSAAQYSIKNKMGDLEVYYKNYISRETSDCLIIQEFTGKTEQFTKRLRLDGSSLNLISYDIVENNTEADMKKTAINQLQFVMLSGKKKNKNYFITDFQGEKPKHFRLYIGDFFIEDDFLLTLLCAFPFEEMQTGSYKVVNTSSVMDEKALSYWELKTFTVSGEETITYKKSAIPTYKVRFPSEKATAWFSQDIPHMLIKAEFPEKTIELVDWNEM